MVRFLRASKKYLLHTFVLVALIVSPYFPLIPTVAYATFNKQINYQGKLTDNSNIAVADGSYNMRFRLYDAYTGGNLLWTETWCYSTDSGATCTGSGTDQRVPVANGLFSTLLGSTTALTGIDFNQTLYLQVEIGGSGATPSFETLSPRKKLGAVPAAVTAENLGGLNNTEFVRTDAVNSTSTASTFLAITQSGAGDIARFVGAASANVLTIQSSGNLGIGTTTPNNKLDIYSTTKSAIGFSGASGSTYKWTIGMDVTNGGRFSIASSSALGTTDRFVIDGNGNVGIGTTTPGSTLSLGNTGSNTINLDINATSTFGSGLNIRTGCYAINGVCLSTGGGTLTGSGAANRAAFWTSAGALSYDDGFAWDNTNKRLGVGTTSPWAQLSVEPNGITGPAFAVGSSTNTSFIVDNGGNIGVGTTSPFALVSIATKNGATGSQRTLFAIASSTSTGTTTLFSISSTGAVGINIAPSTFASQILNINGGILLNNGINMSLTGIANVSGLTAGTSGGNSIVLNANNSTGNLIFQNDSIETLRAGIGNVVGVATSTPWGKLSVGTYNQAITLPSFVIASSSVGVATTTQFIVMNGNVGLGGTTSPGSLLSLGTTGNNTINISTTATSTFGTGLNIRTGCYAINGVCLSTGGGTLTGSGAANRAAFWTAAGNLSYDDSFIWDNTNKNLGISTSTSYAQLSVGGTATTKTLFALDALSGQSASIFDVRLASSSKLTVSGIGYLGVGTSSPAAPLDVYGSVRLSGGNVTIDTESASTFGGSNGTNLIIKSGSGSGAGPTVMTFVGGQGNVGGGLSMVTGGGAGGSGGLTFTTTAGVSVGNILINTGTGGGGGNIYLQTSVSAGGGIISINPTNTLVLATTSAKVGVGTSSPLARLDVAGVNNSTAPLFQLSSVASFATTTQFIVTNAGSVGIGTATPGTTLSLGDTGASTINLDINATSTFGSGLNLRSGCFAINGTCAGGSNLTGSGAANRAAFWTTAGNLSYDDKFVWDNTNKYLGVGSTTPYATLSVLGQNPAGGDAPIAFYALGATGGGSGNTGGGIVLQGGQGGTNDAGVGGLGGIVSIAGGKGGCASPGNCNTGGAVYIAGGAKGGAAGSPSDANLYLAVNSSNVGQGNVTVGTTTSVARLTIDPGAAATAGLILRGFPSQSASLVDIQNSTASSLFLVGSSGLVGVASSTPWANFAINPTAGSASNQFVVGSSTATNFIIKNSGFVGIGGTTSPGTLLSLGTTGNNTITIDTNATSTFGSGINIRTGCYAINGTCLSTGGGSLTGSGAANRAAIWTGSGSLSYDDGFVWDNTNKRLAVGTSTPWANLSVGTYNQATNIPSFVIASSSVGVATTTQFVVLNNAVGIGTSTPSATFSVVGNSAYTDIMQVYGTTPSSGVGQGIQLTAGTGASSALGGNVAIRGGTAGASLSANTGGNVYLVGGAGTGTGAPSGGVYLGVDSNGSIRGNVGVGTTTPWATLAVNPTAGQASNQFVVGSSTATNFIITNGGFIGGGGTTTPGTLFSLGNTGNSTINLDINATSTFGSGINIRTGCFAINGTCLSGGAAGSITGSGAANRATFWTGSGSLSYDDSFVWDNTNKNFGIGTSSPYSQISVGGSSISKTLFALDALSGQTAAILDVKLASTTKFIVSSAGNVGIGLNAPSTALEVLGIASTTQLNLATTSSTGLGGIYVGTMRFAGQIQTANGGNTFLGPNSFNFTMTGRDNVSISTDSTLGNLSALTSGSNNIVIGGRSGAAIQGGSNNTVLGYSALQSDTAGSGNFALGVNTLLRNVCASNSVAIGSNALVWLDSGNSMGCDTTGTVGIGNNAGSGNNNGFFNTYIGSNAGAGVANNSHTANTFIGYAAGQGVTTGGNNTFIGYNAGNNLTSGASNLIIGTNLTLPTATTNNYLSIGNVLYGNTSTLTAGVASTTPWSKFAVSSANASTQFPLFAVASSSAAVSTSTAFIVDWKGRIGIGTTTPSFNFALATSTTAINPVISAYWDSTGASTTVGFFVATSSLMTAGNGTPGQASLKNYIIVGNGKMQAGMGVMNGGVCVDNDGWCAATTTGRISSRSATVGGSDIAEMYTTEDETLGPGDIVSAAGGTDVIRATSNDQTRMLGIVSTEPGFILGLGPDQDEGGQGRVPIALAGRVPVKVNSEGGMIDVGDQITISSTPGVGMKAEAGDMVIAVALNQYSGSGEGTILAFVSRFNGLDITAYRNGSSTDTTGGENGVIETIIRFLKTVGVTIENGITHFAHLVVGSKEKPAGITLYDTVSGLPYCLKVANGMPVTTAGECADSTTGNDGNNGNNGNNGNSGNNNGTTTDSGGEVATSTDPVTPPSDPPPADPLPDQGGMGQTQPPVGDPGTP